MSCINQVPDVNFTISTIWSYEVSVWWKIKIKSADLSFELNKNALRAMLWLSYSKLWWSYPMRQKQRWSLDVVEIYEAWNPVCMLVSVNDEHANTVDIPFIRFLSIDPKAVCQLYEEKIRLRISLEWLITVFLVLGVLRSQSLVVFSWDDNN